jgi:hypothetical protein
VKQGMQIEANPCRLHCGSLCNPPTKKLAKMRPIRTRHIIRCGGQASSPTATRVYIGTRRPQYRQFISSSYHCAALPPSFLFRYRRVIGARRAGLRSLGPSCPYTGQGAIMFFCEVSSRLLAERLLPSTPMFANLRWSASSTFVLLLAPATLP